MALSCYRSTFGGANPQSVMTLTILPMFAVYTNRCYAKAPRTTFSSS